MIDATRVKPITKVEDNEIVAYYDKECDFWYVTIKENNVTTGFYVSDELRDKSEDYILGFLHGLLTK